MQNHKVNPDIARQVTVVGVVMATQTVIIDGAPWHFAVIERVTRPNWVVENVSSHSHYQGARNLDEALEWVLRDARMMP